MRYELRQCRCNAIDQSSGANIAGSHPNDLNCGFVRRREVPVLGDDDPITLGREGADRDISRIAQADVLNVQRFMSKSAQPVSQCRRQLRGYQELHSAAVTTGWLISRAA